jgi:Trp operon repressor
MAQVSKNKLDPILYEQIFCLFPRVVKSLVAKGQSTHLIEAFLTNTERIVIAKRVAIAFMLNKHYTYREISAKLKVSTSTIIDVMNLTKNQGKWLRPILENIAREDEFKRFLEIVGYSLNRVLPPKSGNWSAWRSTIEKEHRKNAKAI